MEKYKLIIKVDNHEMETEVEAESLEEAIDYVFSNVEVYEADNYKLKGGDNHE